MSELDWVRAASKAAHGEGTGAALLAAGSVAFSSRWLAAVAIAALIALFALRRTRRSLSALLAAGLGIGIADPVNHYVFKSIVSRPRPCHVDPLIQTLEACGSGFSMPSNHAANGMAVALAIVVTARLSARTAIPVLVIGLLVGVSRVTSGVHYPTDVLAGWAWGACAGLLAALLARRLAGILPSRLFNARGGTA